VRVTRAVITAAAPSQRNLPLQSLVDRDGVRKSVLQLLIEEARSAGIEAVGVVVHPGDELRFFDALSETDRRGVEFLVQDAPRGYGHAIFCARDFVGGEPFLHQVGDHLFLGAPPAVGSAAHLVQAARAHDCAVSGVQPTRESLLPLFGTVGGRRVAGTHDLYEIERVVEKPTPTQAEQELLVPGLRAGNYLCFVGAHVLTPTVMDLLERHVAESPADRPVQLSPVLDSLAGRERYLAVETPGRRFPMDTRYGLLYAQLGLALSGEDRDGVLAGLVELVATRGVA
jgi:UTP--glucose-1-phosphate uridylyltransferase